MRWSSASSLSRSARCARRCSRASAASAGWSRSASASASRCSSPAPTAWGAEPLFFLDYFACGRLDVDVAADVVKGVAAGCEAAGCALIGGETAEMPGMYHEGEYDLAGFAVGVVEKSGIIDGRSIAAGDAVVGLASSGPHSNGYSLIRSIVDASGSGLDAPFDGTTLGAALLAPTRIYVKPVLALMHDIPVKGMAHITGGGLVENVPRMLPAGLQARLNRAAWRRPPVFDWLQRHGNVADAEMHRVFNCGIGMAIVVAAEHADRAIRRLDDAGERAMRIGAIVAQPPGEPATVVV
jgi:phosphoribosylformylglycinamidine cyclo-ligase